jgi:tripartite-type tricarboxylate transporter receptor subunit TctC
MQAKFFLDKSVAIFALVVSSFWSQATWADTSTIKLLVGFPPGGGTDAIARVLAEKMKDALGANVVVENKAGAGGQIAAQALKASPADGSILFFSHDHTISILPLVVKNPGFAPASDFVPVVGIATFANGLALSGGTPAKSFNEYIQWVRTQGNGKGNVGVPAPASIPEFLVKVIGEKYKLDLQSASYRGSAPLMADMLGNQVPAGLAAVNDFLENHKAGKFRMVAVIGDKRQASMPEVPTFAELGLSGFEELAYYGLFAPVGTPQAVIDRYSDALAKILAQPEVKDRLTSMGINVVHMPPRQFANHVRSYTQTWEKIVKNSGFQAQ